jgi:PAS domain S-box-containing protein
LDVRKDELTWSDEAYQIFGVSKGTPLTYESFLDFIHPDDRRHVDTKWKDALTSGNYDVEHRIVVDGQVKWVRERAELEFDKNGTLLGGFGTVTDITERVQAEKALRQAHDELEMHVKKRTVELSRVNKELKAEIAEREQAQVRTQITNLLLELFAQKTTRKEYLDSVVETIRNWSDCRCVGIRLTNDEGFIPYESFVGFNEQFLSLENMLSLKSDSCLCIRAITQTKESQDMPLLTPKGSFRSDNTFEFLSNLPEKEKTRYRGNCMRHGFTSLAVIPIRYRQEILGAIHLADENSGKVSLGTVEFLENMAMLVGEAVHRFDTETELRESEERYRHLVEVSPDGIGVERNDKIVFINTAGANLLGCSRPEELIGRSIFDFVHPDFKKRTLKQLQFLRKKRKSLPLREERFLRIDGTVLDVETAATPLVYQNKPVTQIVFRDITERKVALERMLADQKQLRLLTAELVLVEERERREIATALHDSIGPILAFTKRELGILQKSAPAKIAGVLKDVARNIGQAVEQTRTLTFDLSPSTLYTFGFETAIEELTEQFCKEHKLEYSFHNCENPKPLADHVKILLYRSVREILINIAKHAKADRIKVAIARANDDIQISVEDNGKGFDASSLNARSSRPKGLGLFSVRERLTHIGGKIEIESAHGKGTRVTLLAPLKLE